jgi:hypothetical protein
MSERRELRLLLALTAGSLLLALGQALSGAGSDLLIAVPALVLLLPLLAGRYLGEDGIATLAARRDAPRAPRPRPVAVHLPRAPRVLPRGGRLVAVGMALRGPPVLTAAR